MMTLQEFIEKIKRGGWEIDWTRTLELIIVGGIFWVPFFVLAWALF